MFQSQSVISSIFHKYLKPNIFNVKSLISFHTCFSSSFPFPNKYTTLCSVAFGKDLESNLLLLSSLSFTCNHLSSLSSSIYKVYLNIFPSPLLASFTCTSAPASLSLSLTSLYSLPFHSPPCHIRIESRKLVYSFSQGKTLASICHQSFQFLGWLTL